MLIIRSTYLILHVQFMQHCKGPLCGRADEKVREMLIMTLHKKVKKITKKKNKIGNSRFLSALYVQTQSILLKLPLPATKI